MDVACAIPKVVLLHASRQWAYHCNASPRVLCNILLGMLSVSTLCVCVQQALPPDALYLARFYIRNISIIFNQLKWDTASEEQTKELRTPFWGGEGNLDLSFQQKSAIKRCVAHTGPLFLFLGGKPFSILFHVSSQILVSFFKPRSTSVFYAFFFRI